MSKIIEQFYKDNYQLLVKRIKARRMQEADAEDVVQEAFVRALKYQDSFNPDRQEIGAWFNTILNNSFKDYRHANFTGDYSFTEEEHMNEFDEAEITWMDQDLIVRIKKEVQEINENHRDIIELVVLNNYKYKEASQILDESIDNIKKVVYRFKQGLREKYGDLSPRSKLKENRCEC